MLVSPRLDRKSAFEMLDRLLPLEIEALMAAMPDLSPVVTYSPTGGHRITEQELRDIRLAVVNLATECGMPGPITRAQEFEGRAARLLRDKLPMTPHEFSHEEVWSYLTCCWLLDVAVWRFGRDADPRRFLGDVNRNTFRRMWWRAEVLGDGIDLTQLGEDELVNITERPTIAADRRLARSVAREFLARVDRGEKDSRSRLMREVMKRLLRLTPYVSFAALNDSELWSVMDDIFTAAAAGLSGDSRTNSGRHRIDTTPSAMNRDRWPEASPEVVSIPRMTISDRAEVAWPPEEQQAADDFETVAQAALDIAQRAGRVTSEGLRAVVPITAEEAREVFQALAARGLLVRRGVKLGTHYVIPEPSDTWDAETDDGPRVGTTSGAARADSPLQPHTPVLSRGTVLRRLLRRGE